VAENLPSRRVDRAALERIIQRAAELQAGEMDSAGEGLTEQEILKLGAEVGIDGRFLRQAMYEQAGGVSASSERGFLAKWVGPGRAAASRVVPGDRAAIEQSLAQWMTDSEALTVRRRLPDATVWERQKGFFAEMKRGFGVGGRSYELAKAKDVTVAVTQLESGFCHVEMSADLLPTRNGSATGAGVSAGVLGVVGIATLAVTGPLPLLISIASVPLVAAVMAPVLTVKAYRTRYARVQLAMEQVLDRLEHGEIKPRHKIERTNIEDLGAQLFGRVGTEIRKALSEPSGAGRKQLPPGYRPPDGR
jgi:hypothetical protein